MRAWLMRVGLVLILVLLVVLLVTPWMLSLEDILMPAVVESPTPGARP